ncbi:hypothetical protein ACSSS7_002445 [Eimeria intestinalis]
MAGQKNVVGSKFEDLRDIINLIENKDRFADACLVRTACKGGPICFGVVLNAISGRHELLGKGKLGLEPFKYIMHHPLFFKDMPLVLETPDPTEGSIWKQEIRHLYSFLEEKAEQ